MPFTHNMRGIAKRLQVVRKNLLVRIETPRLASRNHKVLHANVGRIPPGEQCTTRRRTQHLTVVVFENDAVSCQLIDIWRFDL